MNKFGHELTGWSQAELDKMAIDALIEPPGKGEDPVRNLRNGASQAQQVESILRCAHDEKRRMTWLHTAVENELGRLLMSVGLDITRQRQAESRLRWLASHDAVTDMLNRDSFTYEMNSIIEDAADRKATSALLIVDIDNFQDINDTYGHQTGDSVLSQLSGRLQALCESNAIIGRLGSDEFAVLQENGDSASALRLVEAIGRNLADSPLQVDDRTAHVSTTTGIVLFPKHGDNTKDLLANATLALAQARRVNPGHGHILTLDAEVRAMRRERMHIRDEVAAALADDRFALYYQPILDMRSYRLSHCESLVRMQSPDGRIVPPGAFIEVAEQSGQINAIQHVVLRKAIQMQAELQRIGHPLKISINLAAKTFEDPHLVELVKKLLQQTGADPRQLIFEIVESEAIANMVTAQLITEELTTLGASFAFDDFGVGFTSFEYLRELPVDYVKIDQSFMRNLKERETDRVLVRSMNEMIRRLGLKSVAEGVEDAWTLDYLRDIGVDYCQGYYISRPVPYPPVGAEARAIEQRLSLEAGMDGIANVVTLDHASQPG
jgi:diguanylate cyclase (GGDEF)-like protein